MTPPPFQNFSENSSVLGGGLFPIQKFMLQIFAIIKGTSVMNFGTNPQHDFPKMRGGVKGRLKFFQKFIRFVSRTVPLYRNIFLYA